MTEEKRLEIYRFLLKAYRPTMYGSDTLAELAMKHFYNAESYTDDMPLEDQRIIEDMALNIFVRDL